MTQQPPKKYVALLQKWSKLTPKINNATWATIYGRHCMIYQCSLIFAQFLDFPNWKINFTHLYSQFSDLLWQCLKHKWLDKFCVNYLLLLVVTNYYALGVCQLTQDEEERKAQFLSVATDRLICLQIIKFLLQSMRQQYRRELSSSCILSSISTNFYTLFLQLFHST